MFYVAWNDLHWRFLKGKCARGPFLCILVIECQHMCLIGNFMYMDEQGENHEVKVCF
jgi:hypothetical protein